MPTKIPPRASTLLSLDASPLAPAALLRSPSRLYACHHSRSHNLASARALDPQGCETPPPVGRALQTGVAFLSTPLIDRHPISPGLREAPAERARCTRPYRSPATCD